MTLIKYRSSLVAGLLALWVIAGEAGPAQVPPSGALHKVGPYTVHVAQLIQDQRLFDLYPNALPTLLKQIAAETTVNIDPEPVVISSFADPALREAAFIYVNFDQRSDWHLSGEEISALKQYLERGGFMYVDAGITAEFLRNNLMGQHHSFAEWRARPELVDVMQSVFPGKTFVPLPRSHPLYSIFYKGLPDASILPDTVRDFVVNEKWPQGTYSMVSLSLKGRIAVLASPIIAMGWGKNQLGGWDAAIGFRIRESGQQLSDVLATAAYSGDRYAVAREDGGTDFVYCQKQGLPAWVREPDGKYRVYRYYHSREISEFAHEFYTQLGVNIMMYALTH